MRHIENLRLEFRIPISPTVGFYSQVRAFEFGLRRLGEPYSNALVSVIVGDNCDLEQVRADNSWSGDRVVWHAVPSDIVDEFGVHGTADWRLAMPADGSDIVFLVDADTILVRDINPLLANMPLDRPAVRGHMAHFPPPASGISVPASNSADFWPYLFKAFGKVPWPSYLESYSMDLGRTLPLSPAYFNLGFVALNVAAMASLGDRIFDFQRDFVRSVNSNMRCQIALTLLGYSAGFDIDCLPAPYNAANDPVHLACNYISADDIRVLHYLRGDEINRSSIFSDEGIAPFLARPLANPANRLLQGLAKEYWEVRSRP
ncbi:MAG: hypothetical protein F9K19_17905 [Rhizobiaceae bacterium]|nr:MAG: hypothetical protein F9K19_17905 [Rhizobiaceae bacterium]